MIEFDKSEKADKALSRFISNTKVSSKTLNPLGVVWEVSEYKFYISWSPSVEEEGLEEEKMSKAEKEEKNVEKENILELFITIEFHLFQNM